MRPQHGYVDVAVPAGDPIDKEVDGPAAADEPRALEGCEDAGDGEARFEI